jgi:hypothetical protein
MNGVNHHVALETTRPEVKGTTKVSCLIAAEGGTPEQTAMSNYHMWSYAQGLYMVWLHMRDGGKTQSHLN